MSIEKWKLRTFTLERKIIIFKTIAISVIVFRSFTTIVSKYIAKWLKKKYFFSGKTLLLTLLLLCDDYKAGELKNVDIPKKIRALQCSWIRGRYDNFSLNESLFRYTQLKKDLIFH